MNTTTKGNEMRNAHIHPTIAAIVNAASPAVPSKPAPCRCDAYAFPHRIASGRCREMHPLVLAFYDRAFRRGAA
jgi:hypothetical protein